MKTIVLYIFFALWICQISGNNRSSVHPSTFAGTVLSIDTGKEDKLNTTSTNDTKTKKKRTRIRHADQWERIEPEQSFQKSFVIHIGSNGISEIYFTTTTLSVNGKRGPPVI